MSQGLITSISRPPLRRIRRQIAPARWCDECGYSLRGLPRDQACPECGHEPTAETAGRPSLAPHTAWARSVSIGLVLLLLVTLNAVSSVLVQPFSEHFGGTAPSLNLPAPKLWAMPLLQRPIGKSPEEPGVVGTRTAMLSLLAVWLITAPCTSPRVGRDQMLRLMTRWSSVCLFGLAFGTMMASQGLWPEDLPPFRVMLVAAVELPATTLLYLYLRKLSYDVPGRDRRAAFDRIVWLAPLVIFAGAIILGAQWWQSSGRDRDLTNEMSLTLTALYGAIAMTTGVAASAATCSLALAILPLGFPSTTRVLRFAMTITSRGQSKLRAISPDRVRSLAIASGLALLLLAMLCGNDQIIWMYVRDGVGGNLPFFNYPGPKLWAAATLADGSALYWNSLVARTTLLVIELIAVWLITIPLDRDSTTRLLTRWLTTFAIGATAAGVPIGKRLLHLDAPGHRTEVFQAITILCELPTSVLLYVLLARLASESGRAELARRFRMVAGLIVIMIVVALVICATSTLYLDLRRSLVVIVLCALYGAATLSVAAWATAGVMQLIAAVLNDGRKKEPAA